MLEGEGGEQQQQPGHGDHHVEQLHTRLSGVLRSTEDEDGNGLNICLVLRSGSVVRRQRLGSWGNFRIRSTSFEIS